VAILAAPLQDWLNIFVKGNFLGLGTGNCGKRARQADQKG
jgi:hypothetical protein